MKTLKESITDILLDLEVDDPAHAITDESLDRAVKRLELLINTVTRQYVCTAT